MPITKAEALKDVLSDRDPYCSGVFTVPEQQLTLYYEHGTDLKRINFAQFTTEEVEDLTKACEPASFGFNKTVVLDETYRKAGRMNPDSFSTPFDPHKLGIHDIIEKDLLSTDQAVDLELYKLNVYGEGGFFKAHQDTPRGDSMFGTLVVVLPAPHEGGQLSLRVDERQWIVDFTDQFRSATSPTICFVAFFGDVEHQVLPVTTGHRVTLTYNLYFRSPDRTGTAPHLLGGAFHEQVKRKLVDLVNDPMTLPNGGCLGVGLCHEYAYDEKKTVDESLHKKLKGSDTVLASVCTELGLPYQLGLLYRKRDETTNLLPCDLISPKRLKCQMYAGYTDSDEYGQEETVWELIRDKSVEGIKLIKYKNNKYVEDQCYAEMLNEAEPYHIFKDPVLELLEVKEMSSFVCEGSFAYFGNDLSMSHFYGKVCMMISVKPNESRERLGL